MLGQKREAVCHGVGDDALGAAALLDGLDLARLPLRRNGQANIEHLRELGFETCVISNNKDYRVKPFADAVRTQYVYKADKPSPKGYQEGMRRMNTTPETTLFVGDQLFTDVWGANRAGIYSILVKQIAKHEEIQIVLKRKLEKIVLREYRSRK